MSNKPLYRFLDTVGDGSGTKSAVGNYASATKFFIKPKPGQLFIIARMIVNIVDATVAEAEKYGAMPALSNGIVVKKTANGALVVDYTDGVPIKTNAGWGQVCYDVSNHDWGSLQDDDFIQVRWTFEKASQPLYLNGDKQEQLEVILHDDFTDLVRQYFMIQGKIKAI